MNNMKQRASLLTKHHKLPLISPALAEIDVIVELTDSFDTDTLGTFAGEIPRTLSPLDCVKTKAKLACQISGLRFGIGSEGSFGGGPVPGLLNWDHELLCWYDSSRDQYIIASASGPVPLSDLQTDQLHLLREHLLQHDAAQGWIISHSAGVIKGLIGFDAVCQALEQAKLLNSALQLTQSLRLSPDLRAHFCPSRQQYIRQAATQLADRLRALCPQCQTPDFWRKELQLGLPCSACTYPTQRVKYYLKKCECCGHTEQELPSEASADPAHCPLCNP
jgi:predicted nucleic-acid-binding Zn-ribbon protein